MTPDFAIGIDIGGTKTTVALIDAAGRVGGRQSFPTEAGAGFVRAVGRIAATIRALMAERAVPAARLAGIGIGCAGPVDPVRGLINNPYTLSGWDRCDIVTPLREAFGVPVVLENDADAAALGECWTGAGRGADPVVMLTFGTGVGGGAVHGGRIHRGVGGEHPELGHVAVFPDGPPCYCGIRGCLESVASGTAVGEAGRAHGWEDARAVFSAARAGDATAQAIVERARDAAAWAAWTLVHALLPGRLVLGGGMMDTEFEAFAAAIRRRLSAATQFTRDAVTVVPAALANDAGVIGGARLGFDAAKR